MFLRLTLTEGPSFLVNLDKVLLIEPGSSGGSLLSLSGGSELFVEVAESFEDVSQLLISIGGVCHARDW